MSYKEKNIVVIKVPKGYDAPYFYRGRAYVRIGKTNRVMTSKEIEQFYARKILERAPYDSIQTNAKIAEIDESVVRWFVEKMSEIRGFGIKYVEPKDILERLELVVGDRLKLAGALCFSREPQRFVSYAVIRAGRFRDRTTIIDDQLIEGNVFQQINNALIFIKKHINISFKIAEDGSRIEVWEYPQWSLREAIINAVVHRDYSIYSPIYLRIFDDRIEIESPGRLPEPLTVDDLKGPHTSILRNPLLGKIMFLAGYIETWGLEQTN